MRQGNAYVVIFAVVMTVVCGGLLAGVAVALKDDHQKQELLDKQRKILSAVMGSEEVGKMSNDQVDSSYISLVQKNSFVLDANGQKLDVDPLDVDPRKEYKKKDNSDKRFPVFVVESEVYSGKTEAYVLPVYGNGLWDMIWGYIAIADDKNTIKGAVFDHKAETPGLGARIADDKSFQNRFVGKKIKNESGDIESVEVIKGEGTPPAESEVHKVDGLSGASMTTKGVNKMLKSYFNNYKAFLKQ